MKKFLDKVKDLKETEKRIEELRASRDRQVLELHEHIRQNARKETGLADEDRVHIITKDGQDITGSVQGFNVCGHESLEDATLHLILDVGCFYRGGGYIYLRPLIKLTDIQTMEKL